MNIEQLISKAVTEAPWDEKSVIYLEAAKILATVELAKAIRGITLEIPNPIKVHTT